MKYKHYAPNAEVIVVSGEHEKTAKYINENIEKDDGVLCFEEDKVVFKNVKVISFGSILDMKKNASRLFASLRKFDDYGVKRIFVQCPEEKGIGIAIINRLYKAAGR